MLATPTVYCLTPSRAFSRTPARATTLIRDIKRKSMRMKRSCSFRLDTTPGRFVQLDEEEMTVEQRLRRLVFAMIDDLWMELRRYGSTHSMFGELCHRIEARDADLG